ncbi:glycoside hydrolase family 31 protein [Fulvivirga maritima]|uniref:glycoside hydrolase family 31 protein n=1 Tax=Fulvivirga maritima TaxID=2904247 RepID=UPI001F2C7682|nr:glycoside hydrolase family 31 protein [Fulvivirga maritima]UII25274.1 glycoside hydrolase family 31 protein [Fulvivirga maritima]
MLSTVNTQKITGDHGMGKLLNYSQQANGIEGTTTHASFQITIYTAHIFRIHITAQQEPNTNPYSVITQPTDIDFKVEENDEQVIISTSELVLQIDKASTRLSFLTTDGKTINEDDTFGTSWIGEQVTTYKKLQEGERFIGLGEKTGPLDRRGHGYQHWNTDYFGYPEDADPLYCSTPFYIGIHNQLSYGIFLDNSHKTHFNFGASNRRFSSFSADSGDMDYYFIHHEEVKDIISSYSHLTGRMELPPLWSIGYQQCRYSYYPDKEVLNIAQNFRDREIPADVIVLDIHYMDNYKIFSWDKEKFANPQQMLQKLRDMGFHVVVMCDPGIKIEEGYPSYEEAKDKDLFLKYPDGSLYEGQVWPGWCHFPDFTKEETRVWWKEQFAAYTDLEIDGFWNDMNEIATWGQKLPDLIRFHFEGEESTARKGRNIYGFLMAKSTFEGSKSLLNNKRPFVLTRAGFSGIQRYAAVWTGDNTASDEHMMLGARLVNSMGLTGIPFAGYDVGGFVGNASEKLFARWIQIGAFSPFFRGHSNINTRDAEPWAFGEEVEEISRNYIKLRYRLIPYIYSLFYEATQSGVPLSRSLAIDYTHDSKIYEQNYQNQYLFGPALLVAPVESTKDFTKIYFPEGDWYHFFSDELTQGAQEKIIECPFDVLPLFVKASSIIPMAQTVKNNTNTLGDTMELHVYYGENSNSFEYYEDDGETYNYQDENYCLRKIHFSPKRIEISKQTGKYLSKFSTIKLCLHGFKDQSFIVNGKEIKANEEEYRFIEPVSNFDPIYTEPNTVPEIKALKSIEFTNTTEAISIQWSK